MIGKLCAAPKGSSSANGLVEYLVGYAITGKGASRKEIAEALDAVYNEAAARDDYGADVVWEPAAGGGTRPSSVLVRNCASLSTASLEMDADALQNPGVRTSALHFVWSFTTTESAHLSDEQAHRYVADVLEGLGLEEHRVLAVVHRDTLVFERDADGGIRHDEHGRAIVLDGNLHVHVAVGSVHPRTGLAYDRTSVYRRMAWAEREVELKHGLDHDRGLAVVRNAGTPNARVEWADKAELAAWRAERREQRLSRLQRRTWEAYASRDGTFARYADATVAPRLRTALELTRERGGRPDWATLHATAAAYGCEIQRDSAGSVVLRDVGVGEMRLRHESERRERRARLKSGGADRETIEHRVAELHAEHERAEAAEWSRKRESGEAVSLDRVLRDASVMHTYRTLEESERDLVALVARNPGMVLDEVTAHSSTFLREDVDEWLCARLSDPSEVERLGDLVVAHDDVRVLAADTAQPLMTTTTVLAVEDALDEDARTLAKQKTRIDRERIERAIREYEAERTRALDEAFALSDEQRRALNALENGSLIGIEGLPGTGKTTIMGALRVLARHTGRKIVGLTLSQASAERLESEAGFACANIARARMLEESGELVIPRDGIVVVDEAAMVDSQAKGRILRLARERNSVVVDIFDIRQLQPVDFGASARIVRAATQGAGTYTELRDIQRQRNSWHKVAVATLADAIAERDSERRLGLVERALRVLDEHWAITWVADRDEAIDAAVGIAQSRRDSGLRDTMVTAGDRDTIRHLAEEDRRLQGRAGRGLCYVTDGGTREFAVGDRLMFLENSLGGKRSLGVRNGDRGEVVEVRPNRIGVRLDSGGRVVRFSPRSYRSFDYAGACTVHKAQGANVDASVTVVDRSATAELLFVAVSRSRSALDVVVPRSSFENLRDLAVYVAERITLKTTTRTFDELVQRTGGRETMRVRNIEAQRAAEPLRRIYDAEIVEPARALRARRIEELRHSHRAARLEISLDLSLADRLEAERAATRDFRRACALAFRQFRPAKSFADWLIDRERASAKARDLAQRRHGSKRDLQQAQDVRCRNAGTQGRTEIAPPVRGARDPSDRGSTFDRQR